MKYKLSQGTGVRVLNKKIRKEGVVKEIKWISQMPIPMVDYGDGKLVEEILTRLHLSEDVNENR